ncbi:MAG TPA: hypothetical protein VGD69_03920 [Herpetosiphonaceae bacterium]
MNRKPRSGQEAASILQGLFNAADDLSCEQAQQQLPGLVDDERAGVDVDQIPAYAALLQHLDHCADCTDLYEALSENLAALTNEQVELPPANVTPPAIFAPGRRSGPVVIRVLQGLKRRFALDIAMLTFRPAVETLGKGPQIQLFTAKLPELAGNPFVSVVLKLGAAQPALAVTIREGSRPATWHVQFHLGEQVYSATTDEHGIAELTGFTLEQLRTADQMAVSCAETTAQPNAE